MDGWSKDVLSDYISACKEDKSSNFTVSMSRVTLQELESHVAVWTETSMNNIRGASGRSP